MDQLTAASVNIQGMARVALGHIPGAGGHSFRTGCVAWLWKLIGAQRLTKTLAGKKSEHFPETHQTRRLNVARPVLLEQGICAEYWGAVAFNVVTAWDMEAHGNDPRHLRTAMLWLRAVNTGARRVQKVGGYGVRLRAVRYLEEHETNLKAVTVVAGCVLRRQPIPEGGDFPERVEIKTDRRLGSCGAVAPCKDETTILQDMKEGPALGPADLETKLGTCLGTHCPKELTGEALDLEKLGARAFASSLSPARLRGGRT
eukprot:g16124.t1